MEGYAWLDVGGILSYPTADHRYRISGGVRQKRESQPCCEEGYHGFATESSASEDP
jgi:hypothetical protein